MGELPEKVRSRLNRDPETGCWEWTGAKTGVGYGEVRWEGRTCSVHRLVHELLIGPIPQELELDHLCRVRHCANPDHLEPVTHEENMRRARLTHCRKGHELTPENTYVMGRKRRVRQCKRCTLARNRAWRERRRAA